MVCSPGAWHKIFCVLLRWLLERKKWPGDVVTHVEPTHMLDRIAEEDAGRALARNVDWVADPLQGWWWRKRF